MKIIILTAAMVLVTLLANAQLKGSGKTLTKTFDYQNFDKINFNDLDGKIEVEIGLSWSITVTIDDNLFPLLSFKDNQPENELTIYFKENYYNNKYIENSSVKIKITMPEASVIKNSGNSDIKVTGITGRYFRIEIAGNGDAVCSGSIDYLDIEKTGNGDVNAKLIAAKNAKIKSVGNGDVIVNVTENITAKNTGNGDVKNTGKAKFDDASKSQGNGELIEL
ncbi:GIN domain-containing protein [Flavobacterium sp.]|uniref:GIN domain-containing protein n=1 Tax=Flavobacterium sp. TaxID=239 RepID=UPI00286B13BA|nr:DUF2807 domain-containing protein [Flavobacterium sp.]